MAFKVTHELHERRRGRNLGVGLLLLAFIVLVFFLTVVKVERMAPQEASGAAAQATPSTEEARP